MNGLIKIINEFDKRKDVYVDDDFFMVHLQHLILTVRETFEYFNEIFVICKCQLKYQKFLKPFSSLYLSRAEHFFRPVKSTEVSRITFTFVTFGIWIKIIGLSYFFFFFIFCRNSIGFAFSCAHLYRLYNVYGRT